MEDVNRWNALTPLQREELLRINPWQAYNDVISKLDVTEIRDLQNHDSFLPLRQAFTQCMASGSPTDRVKTVTDMLFRAVEEIRGKIPLE